MLVPELVAAVRPHLAGALIATDFDGTLAPLVADPQDSRPVPGTVEALSSLTRRGARIAVITGRDARTVVRLGGLDAVPGLVVAGLYGIETWIGGALTTPDEPPALEELRRRLPAVVDGIDAQAWMEDKRLSLVVHARRAADPAATLARLREPVQHLADEFGLEIHPGSGVLELRLPGHDKAAALDELAGGTGAVLFLGDDLGDIPAFARIRALRADGRPAWSVGVLASGADGVTDAVDVTVADPAAALALLRRLAE